MLVQPKPAKGTGKALRTKAKLCKKETQKKKVKRSKKPSIPKGVRTKCLSEFQKLRKLQEERSGWCTCISCGKAIKYGTNECQGGHYITRANNATCIEHDNIWPQCVTCNVLRKGNPYAYRFNLQLQIGDARVERLEYMALAREGNKEAVKHLSKEDLKLALKKWTNKDWYEKYKEFKEEVKRLEHEKLIN